MHYNMERLCAQIERYRTYVQVLDISNNASRSFNLSQQRLSTILQLLLQNIYDWKSLRKLHQLSAH